MSKRLIMVVSSAFIRPICLSQHNETHKDWKMQAEVCGEGFSGPEVLYVPAGTRACYPLTFYPSAQCTVMVISFVVVVSIIFLCLWLPLSHTCYLTNLLIINILIDHGIFIVLWSWVSVCVQDNSISAALWKSLAMLIHQALTFGLFSH